MNGIFVRNVGRLAIATVILTMAAPASAQLFGRFGRFGRQNCNDCQQTAALPPTYAMAAAPAYASMAPQAVCGPAINCAPQTAMLQTAAINPCPCMQQVQQTVYQQVPVTEYKAVQKTVQVPKHRTEYVDQKVTAYRQVMDTRTVQVPSTQYQQVTECQQMTVDRSRWQTVYQPRQQLSVCEVDSRPGFQGWWGRTAYQMRSAFTPKYTRHRVYQPNVVAYNVPTTRTVAVPTTRQVTYNVARMEPYETTQKVARTRVEYVDETVTAYEPVTTMKTVAVGTQTRMAYVPLGGGTTATAAAPTPADTTRSANSGTATDRDSSLFRQQSFERSKQIQKQPEPRRPLEARNVPPVANAQVKVASASNRRVPSVVTVSGWRSTRPRTGMDAAGPDLSVAAK